MRSAFGAGTFILLAACGRWGFDAPRTGSDAAIDDNAIVPIDSASGLPRQSLVIAAAADDGEIDFQTHYPDGELKVTPGHVLMGSWFDEPTWSYHRFQLQAALPSGATVVDARLHLWGRSTIGWGAGHALVIVAQVSPDAAPITMLGEEPSAAGGVTVTSAMVRWPASGDLTWMIDAWNVTPNLAPLFDELLASTGNLSAGAHVQLWLRGDTFDDDAEAACEDFDVAESHHTRLEIEWSEP